MKNTLNENGQLGSFSYMGQLNLLLDNAIFLSYLPFILSPVNVSNATPTVNLQMINSNLTSTTSINAVSLPVTPSLNTFNFESCCFQNTPLYFTSVYYPYSAQRSQITLSSCRFEMPTTTCIQSPFDVLVENCSFINAEKGILLNKSLSSFGVLSNTTIENSNFNSVYYPVSISGFVTNVKLSNLSATGFQTEFYFQNSVVVLTEINFPNSTNICINGKVIGVSSTEISFQCSNCVAIGNAECV